MTNSWAAFVSSDSAFSRPYTLMVMQLQSIGTELAEYQVTLIRQSRLCSHCYAKRQSANTGCQLVQLRCDDVQGKWQAGQMLLPHICDYKLRNMYSQEELVLESVCGSANGNTTCMLRGAPARSLPTSKLVCHDQTPHTSLSVQQQAQTSDSTHCKEQISFS